MQNLPKIMKTFTKINYSRFWVTFQNAVAKFVLNIPNYITKLAKPNLQVVAEESTEVTN